MSIRLKSLELHGYKTFAGRWLFDFPGQVTVIVGPNGSGKSNIADALRWVLGEQSYSLLRGRKTEDMIFSGSEHRPRAGMASAVVTFDNEDGWLPIDFSEVSVSRRAYRDGQNEYLINSQRVRLKEISELLGQSGLSERTYTIIGQGLVDAALSLKPDERRRFFEEAAGIGLFRARREEAINRLDSTRRNLERVQDILSELAPRLRSLERQAQRAIEYDRIKADLRLLMREWYGYHWHRMQLEVGRSQQALAAQDERLGSARHHMIEVEADVTLLREEIQGLRSKLNIWHTELAELHTKSERVSRSLAVLDERQRATQDQEKNRQSDLVRLEEEDRARQARLVELQDECKRMQTELEEAQTQASAAQKTLNKRQAERNEIDNRRREARRLLTDYETRQVQRKAHLQELTNRLDSISRSQQNLRVAIENAATSLEQAVIRQTKAGETKVKAEQERDALDARNQDFQARLVELESNRRQLQDQLSRLTTEESRLKAQISVLEQADASLNGLNQGAQAVLKEARNGSLPGTFQSLSTLCEVPAEFEQAIAAAFGEHLDAILLRGADPDAVIEYLQSSQKGRATLFPQAWLQKPPAVKLPDDRECVGLASDFVQCPAELRGIVDLILGQVIVVRNRQAARRIVPTLPISSRVVTLQGEVFAGSGAVTAGRDPRSSVIARPRQKREMQDTLAQTQAAIQSLQQEIDALHTQRELLRNDQTLVEKQLREANMQVTTAGQVLQQASLALEQVRQKEEFQRSQLTDSEEQARKTKAEADQTTAELSGLAESIQKQNEVVRQLQHNLNEHPLEELQTQLVHWNTQAAVAARAGRDAARRLEEWEQSISASRRQQELISTRLEELHKMLAEIETQKTELRSQENELAEAIHALQVLIEPADQDLKRSEDQYEALQVNYTSAQQAMTLAERHVAQAQLELGRNRDQLDSLKRRIEEDFGLVAFEYTSEVSGQTPLPLEGMVEQLPTVVEIAPEVEESINRQRAQLRRIGAINPEAHREYIEVKERHEFLTGQLSDLRKADEDLRMVITELDELMRREFRRTFDAVAIEFRHMFTRLFGGGSARLVLTDEEHPTETGIDIEARLPGRREQGLSLLSGGERSLTAVALIFSLLKVSPTPFCVLDEVDAMLDEANVGRFTELLRELSQTTQFIVISHNRNTVQVADVIYGVTMGKDSASQVISLRLDEVGEEMVR